MYFRTKENKKDYKKFIVLVNVLIDVRIFSFAYFTIPCSRPPNVNIKLIEIII